jgi:hypothetical protein
VIDTHPNKGCGPLPADQREFGPADSIEAQDLGS